MSHTVMASGEADKLASKRLPARDHDQIKLFLKPRMQPSIRCQLHHDKPTARRLVSEVVGVKTGSSTTVTSHDHCCNLPTLRYNSGSSYHGRHGGAHVPWTH